MGVGNGEVSRKYVSALWRILAVSLPLAAGLAASMAILPAGAKLSDPSTLLLRIAAGLGLCALTLAAIALLLRFADRMTLSEAGLTPVRHGWRLAAWGALLWSVPAAAAFGVLALAGNPLTLTQPFPEVARTVVLLGVAVLVTEAIPEETVFRGYILTALRPVAGRWAGVVVQAALFTLFAGLLRQSWDLTDLSLFFAMGVGFGYLRMLTGSIWMSVGFHTAFQTGSQLVMTHAGLEFGGDPALAMVALGAVPFTAAAIALSSAAGKRMLARAA